MRNLILQVNTSIDMYMTGPNNAMDFMNHPWTDDLNNYIDELLSTCDRILLGRKLAEGFIPHWLANPDSPGADKINALPKSVFSKTLGTENPWGEGTEVVGEDFEDAIKKMKDEGGKGNLIAFGGVQFAQQLLEAKLVDEMLLIVNSKVLGAGGKLFTTGSTWKLLEARAFDSGAALLKYQFVE